tara:strand:- start:53484 stop:54038 length:555 start_codon:yes stop_codon:yes gene_type:complete
MWTMKELGVSYRLINDKQILQYKINRNASLNGIVTMAEINGKQLYESGAISTYLADIFPRENLISTSGTWQRALHDQWTNFCYSEMDSWLTSIGVNRYMTLRTESDKIALEKHNKLFSSAASVLNEVLSDSEYLIDDKFSVTDIIVGYSVNWANNWNMINEFQGLQNYLKRLHERPNCSLLKPY